MYPGPKIGQSAKFVDLVQTVFFIGVYDVDCWDIFLRIEEDIAERMSVERPKWRQSQWSCVLQWFASSINGSN